MRIPTAIASVILSTCLAGCGGPTTATVSGNVTFNGQPVVGGAITLWPEDGKGAVSGAGIENGRYEIRGVSPGVKIVRLTAPVALGTTGKDDYGNTVEGRADLMPPSWGQASKEKLTVAAPQTSQDFAVEGPDPRKKK
jgi:hypothetical protein